MKKKASRTLFIIVWVAMIAGSIMGLASCTKQPSKVEAYHAEKHVRDSVSLGDQERSLVYYQSLLDSMQIQADSLVALFKYEKNDKYQDHGQYVIRNEKLKNKYSALRVMVRDDGRDLSVYHEGERLEESEPGKWTTNNRRAYKLTESDRQAIERAQHLQIVIKDIQELEKRIAKTSLEIQKYQKRLEKN